MADDFFEEDEPVEKVRAAFAAGEKRVTTAPTITLDSSLVAGLVAHALASLDGWPEPEDEDAGCCPWCCAPCASLRTLLRSGQLDDAARPYALQGDPAPDDCVAWWDGHAGQVDREWLRRGWRETACHRVTYFEVDGAEFTADVREEDNHLWAQVRELPGCFSTGESLTELLDALEEGVRMVRPPVP